jgi:hypothetical protein
VWRLTKDMFIAMTAMANQIEHSCDITIAGVKASLP